MIKAYYFEDTKLKKLNMTELKTPFLKHMKQQARKMGIPYQEINVGHFPMIEAPQFLSVHLVTNLYP